MIRLRWFAGIALAFGACAGTSAPTEPPRLDTADHVALPPAGAFVAEDERQLAAALADPLGPAEIWLKPRIYQGDLAIHRKVAVRGAGPATILHGSGRSTVVDILADGASLQDLTVRHSGSRFTSEDAGIRAKGKGISIARVKVDGTLFGISLQLCPGCSVEHARVVGRGGPLEIRGDGIKVWESNDARIAHCVVTGARDLVVWYARRVILEDNTVHDCRYGTHFMYAHDAVVRRSHLVGNVVGIFVMYSARMHVEDNVLAGARGAAGIGLGFKDSDAVVVRNNRIVGNTTGLYLDQTPRSPDQPVLIEGNEVALDGTGLRLHGNTSGVHLRGNDLRDNGEVVAVEGGGDALEMDCDGNFWSEYAGYDLDGDGKGDVAFELRKLTSDLTDAHPQIRWYHATVAMGILETVARALPLLASDNMLIDAHPAMRPHRSAP